MEHGIAKYKGISLVEVMVAVAVFSIGLLGVSTMLITATRANQSAYLRTQATFLAGDMAERMRANPIGVWNQAYNGNHYPEQATPGNCDADTSCSPAQVALRDRAIWSRMLRTHLPGVAGSAIECKDTSTGFDPRARLFTRPPYGGYCTMEIRWAEKRLAPVDGTAQAGQQRSFSWKFRP
jgi:type IV pilus assembly protein PilV